MPSPLTNGHTVCRNAIPASRKALLEGTTAVLALCMGPDRGGGMVARFAENVARAEAALDLAGFPATMHNMAAGALPIFHRKLVMIASALALLPSCLLLDEPASSLTRPEIARMRALIEALRAQGLTILLIEHVLPLLTAVSDRLMVLDQGRVIAEGTPAAVIRDPKVIEAYLGGSAA